jgi:hypothetical protein
MVGNIFKETKMNFINVMNTKVQQKVSLVLWAASLALLMQAQPLHAMSAERDINEGKPQFTLENISEDESLSINGEELINTLGMENKELNKPNIYEALEFTGRRIKMQATQFADAHWDLLFPGINNHDPKAIAFEVALDAQNTTTDHQLILFERLARNAAKFLKNLDRAQRRKEAETKKAIELSMTTKSRKNTGDK